MRASLERRIARLEAEGKQKRAAKQGTRITLAPPLPCVAFAGWGYCGNPATIGVAELRKLATGHYWELRPYCPEHDPERS